jgi:ribosome-associated toxin RatA of RatAB toxin-antitoxin module
MTKITQIRTIQAPADRVWDILADFGGVHIFHPLVESSRIINGQDTGLGAERRCDLYNGGEAIEKITSFVAERRHLGITVRDGPGPMEAMTGELTVTPVDDNSCEVRADLQYRLKGGAAGEAVDAEMMRAMMDGVVETVLKGLEDHAVTGAIIGNAGEHVSTQASAAA